ncbi:DUF4221 family protein [Fulvivirgaceae bacterium LMO-SS25]
MNMIFRFTEKYITLLFLLTNVFFASGQEYELQKSGSKKIELTLSTAYNKSYTYLEATEWKSTPSIALLNHKVKTIEVYSLASGKLLELIHLYDDGPNRVGNSTTAFHIYAPDSIFVFDSGPLMFSLINNKGEKLNSFTNSDAVILGNPIPFVPYKPLSIQSKNGKLYVTGIRVYKPFYDDKGKLLVSINIKTGKEEYLFRRPQFYEKVFYASPQAALPHFAINGEFFVISTPSSNYIQVNEKDKPAKYYLAKSAEIDTIMPYATKMPSFIDPNTMAEESVLKPNYQSIIYDPYRNFYYRIAKIPPTKDQWVSTKRRIGKMTVIILDKNFQKVGETEIDYAKYDVNGFFMSKEGLNFVNMEKYRENEDELVFDAFVPVRK